MDLNIKRMLQKTFLMYSRYGRRNLKFTFSKKYISKIK